MNKIKLVVLTLFVLFLFSNSACNNKGNRRDESTTEKLILNYAKGFDVFYRDGYKEILVYNPWKKGEIYASYCLVEQEETQLPEGEQKIIVPLKSIALNSVTHIEFLRLLNKLNTVTGISSPKYVYNSDLRAAIEKGEITNLGDAFNLNVEKTLFLKPAAFMASGFNQEDANLLRLEKAGIPVIYNNEWMESSVLARAEWIKFIATFYDKEEMADSIFKQIEKGYNDTKELAKKSTHKPKILSGSNFRGTWYMPGGKSYMATLFSDAYADYFYAGDSTIGSLPLNQETVFMNFSDAEIWLNCNFNSIDELINDDKKNALFSPVKTNRVYNFNKRLLPSGANDFWESAIARPDLLLMDLVAVLHPEIKFKHELYYTSKLKN